MVSSKCRSNGTKKLDSFMMNNDFSKTTLDHFVVMKKFCNGKFNILMFYGDDMVIVRQDSTLIYRVKLELS